MKRFFHTNTALPKAHKQFHVERCRKKNANVVGASSSQQQRVVNSEASSAWKRPLGVSVLLSKNKSSPESTQQQEKYLMIRTLLGIFILWRNEKHWFRIEELLRKMPVSDETGNDYLYPSTEEEDDSVQHGSDILLRLVRAWHLIAGQESNNTKHSQPSAQPSQVSPHTPKDSVNNTHCQNGLSVAHKTLSDIIRKCESYLHLGNHANCSCSESELSSSIGALSSSGDEDDNLLAHHRESRRSVSPSPPPHVSVAASPAHHSTDSLSDRSTASSAPSLDTSVVTQLSSEENQFLHTVLLIALILQGDLKRITLSPQAALDCYQHALHIESKFSIVHFKLGILYQFDLCNVESSLLHYNRCIDTQQTPISYAYMNRALLHTHSSNDQTLALQDFTKAIEIDSNPKVFFNRANLYASLARHEEALKDYNVAIQLDPLYTEAYLNRGLLKYDALEDHEGALSDLTKAIELDQEGNILPFIYRADLNRIHFKSLEAALADYNKCLELCQEQNNQNIASVLLSRALVHDMMQNWELCAQDLSQSLELEPDNEEVRLIRATFFFQHMNFESALQDVNHVLAEHPNHKEALLKRSEIYEYGMQEFEQTLFDVDRLIELSASSNESAEVDPALMMRKEHLINMMHMRDFHMHMAAAAAAASMGGEPSAMLPVEQPVAAAEEEVALVNPTQS